MHILKMILVVMLLSLLSTPAQAIQRSQLIRLPPPEDAEVSGCPSDIKPQCVALGDKTRICKCHVEDAAFFMVERNGALLGRCEATPNNATAEGFEVLRGDLDGDHGDEIVVANHDSTSNGLAVTYWTIAIIPDPQNHP
jgi:hypothetical protein